MKEEKWEPGYAEQCWSKQLGVEIIEHIDSIDYSEAYETDACHLYKMTNDKYLVVTERGCSCYSYDDADLEVFDTKDQALTEFNKFRKPRSSE